MTATLAATPTRIKIAGTSSDFFRLYHSGLMPESRTMHIGVHKASSGMLNSPPSTWYITSSSLLSQWESPRSRYIARFISEALLRKTKMELSVSRSFFRLSLPQYVTHTTRKANMHPICSLFGRSQNFFTRGGYLVLSIDVGVFEHLLTNGLQDFCLCSTSPSFWSVPWCSCSH